MEYLTGALGASLTPARLAAAVQAALGQPVPPGLLTPGETELIGADLFPAAYRAQIGPSLVRLDAFVSGLARYTGTGARPARPARYTCLALEPGARSARAELLIALAVQWLTIRVSQSTATVPAVIVAGADEITREHLEALSGACERRGVPLTLLFRHLRDDATALIGGAAATAFMRLGNHHEAEQAATFIGRQHTFTVSGWTVTHGGEHSTSRTAGYSHGISQTRGWSGDGLFPRPPSGRKPGPATTDATRNGPSPTPSPTGKAGVTRGTPSGCTSMPSSPPSCRTCPATPCCSRHAAPPAPTC